MNNNGWQPIESAPRMRKVIVYYRNAMGRGRTVMARYYNAYTLEMGEHYQDMGEWDEATGRGYAPAGWYEEIDHDGEIYSLGGDPTHWQPLPAPPISAVPESPTPSLQPPNK